MCNTETLLTEAQGLFYKGNHPVVVYYELDTSRIIQLMRCVTPYSDCGITITMFVLVDPVNAGQDAEFSPEFAVSMDGRRLEILIDPFGNTPEQKGFCSEIDLVETFMKCLFSHAKSVGHPFNYTATRRVA